MFDVKGEDNKVFISHEDVKNKRKKCIKEKTEEQNSVESKYR